MRSILNNWFGLQKVSEKWLDGNWEPEPKDRVIALKNHMHALITFMG